MLDKHEHTRIKTSSQTIVCNYIWDKKLNLASLEVWLQLFMSSYHHQHAGIILLDAHVALHFINITSMQALYVSLLANYPHCHPINTILCYWNNASNRPLRLCKYSSLFSLIDVPFSPNHWNFKHDDSHGRSKRDSIMALLQLWSLLLVTL
jgi:hypothetical protein